MFLFVRTQPPPGRGPLPAPRPALARRLRWTAWLVLVLGLVAAGVVYLLAPDVSAAQASEALIDQRLYEYDVERVGGKAMLYMARFDHWLVGLWHGRNLARTVAVLALIVAAFCFWLADAFATPVEPL